MREELRRRLPRIQAWGPFIVVAGVVILAGGGFAAWKLLLSDSPTKMVNSVIRAAREGDPERIRRSVTEESLSDPESDLWLDLLTGPLTKPETVVVDDSIMGDIATVFVSVTHRTGSGAMTTTRVPVHTERRRKGWQIDLKETMSTTNLQIWITVQTEAR